MGMNELFNGSGDLSYLTSTPKFGLAGVIQKVKMEVNEEFVPIVTKETAEHHFSRMYPTHLNFRCEYPFLFVIYDTELHQILFTGVYRNPQ